MKKKKLVVKENPELEEEDLDFAEADVQKEKGCDLTDL